MTSLDKIKRFARISFLLEQRKLTFPKVVTYIVPPAESTADSVFAIRHTVETTPPKGQNQ